MEPLDEKRRSKMKAGDWTSGDETVYYKTLSKMSQYDRAEKQVEFINKYIHYEDVVQEELFLSLRAEADQKRHDKYFEGLLEPDECKYEYADENARWFSLLSTEKRELMKEALLAHEKTMDRIEANRKSNKSQQPKIKEIIPEKVQVGKTFIDFSGTTADGKPFSLNEAVRENKLVMLDFWASWCLPCLKMMPEVASLYENYKDKGLLVVGISSDQSEDAWRKAMERFGMIWPQVRSTKENRIGSIYGIRTIPYAILISSDGTIVARNLRGEELAAKIAEILK